MDGRQFQLLAQLRPKQQAAAIALGLGQTVVAAARSAGVTEKSVYRWLQMPDFVSAVDGLKQVSTGDFMSELYNLRGQAIAGLVAAVQSARDDLHDQDPDCRAEARTFLLLSFKAMLPTAQLEPQTQDSESLVHVYLPNNDRGQSEGAPMVSSAIAQLPGADD